MTYNGLVHAILDASPSVAALIAQTMAACEAQLLNGHFVSGEPLDPTLFPRDALLEQLPKKEARDILRNIEKLTSEFEILSDKERFSSVLSKVIIRAWIEEVDSQRSARPDVLRLTAEILANPDYPPSVPITHFAIILALRVEYQIHYTKADLKHLQDVHGELKDRFAQKTRRMKRNADQYEAFIIDLLCFKNRIWRTLTGKNLLAYYRGFRKSPLGIGVELRRDLSSEQDLPQLRGELPDFPSLLNMIFGQPSCIPGIDDVIGGLVPAAPDSERRRGLGGHITLVTGAPGSGKTSLCLTLASRIAELGGMVRYVSTEEDVAGLDLKQVSIARESALAKSLFPDASEKLFAKPDFKISPGYDFLDIADLARQLEIDLSDSETSDDDIFLPFMRMVVIDSLTVLLNFSESESESKLDIENSHVSQQSHSSRTPSGLRKRIGSILRGLRELGVAVFLIANDKDDDTRDLEYLADNVFHLGVDSLRSPQHPIRTLSVEKTRFQVSHRGKHIVHLSRHDGFSVSPSLHSVIRSLSEERITSTNSAHKVLVYTEGAQMSLPFTGARDILTIRSLSRVLVYGRGTAGKSRFALKLALEPRLPESFFLSREAIAYEQSLKGTIGQKWLERCRLLVISFLFGASYYDRIVRRLLRSMFAAESSGRAVRDHLTVIDFYPGFIDAETVVMRVRRELDRATLSGRRYTAVVIDGVHNALLQFPLLEKESLLWPALYRICAAQKIDVITTFTFFSTSADAGSSPESLIPNIVFPHLSDSIDLSQRMFWHLLVSGSDYTFVVERTGNEIALRPDAVRITLATSIDRMEGVVRQFLWDPYRGDTED